MAGSRRRKLSFETPRVETKSLNPWFADDGYFGDTTDAVTLPVSASKKPLEEESSDFSIGAIARDSFFPPAEKINCELENTFAEIAKFIEDKVLYKLGNTCPAPSPKKVPHFPRPFVKADDLSTLVPYVSSQIQLSKQNRSLRKSDDDCGRNYPKLMEAMQSFTRQVSFSSLSSTNFKVNMKKVNPALSEELLEKIKTNLIPMQLAVFLYFVDKYPLYPIENMYSDLLKNKEIDIYQFFKAYDNYLYQNTLTKAAAEPYLFVMEIEQRERKSV